MELLDVSINNVQTRTADNPEAHEHMSFFVGCCWTYR
jgi:hypothetical protein